MLCLIRPQDDKHSVRVAEWWEPLDAFAAKLSPIQRVEKTSSREMAEAAVEGARAVMFFGHGSPEALCGEELLSSTERVRLLDAENIGLASGSIVFAAACSSLSILGSASVDQGVRAYIGFRRPVLIPIEMNEAFGQTIRDGLVALLQGRRASEVTEIVRRALKDLADYCKESREGPSWLDAIIAAEWMIKELGMEGDSEARLTL